MNTLNSNKTGLVFGIATGGVHLVWSILVLVGVAQVLIDFILWAHMIQLPYVVGPFSVTQAAILVVVTAGIGYVVGYVVAIVWNKVHGV